MQKIIKTDMFFRIGLGNGIYFLVPMCMLVLSALTFPSSGFWHLIDLKKLIDGAILYKDVESVVPPLYYLIIYTFNKIGVDSIWGFRLVFIAIFTICFAFLFQRYKKVFGINAIWASLCFGLYIQTPWEIFITYTFISEILALIAVGFYQEKRVLAYIFATLSFLLKITIGGSVLIGFFLVSTLSILMGLTRVDLKKFIFGCALVALTLGIVLLFSNLIGLDISIISFFEKNGTGESKGGFLHSLKAPYVSLKDIIANHPALDYKPSFYKELVYPLKYVLSYWAICIEFFIWWHILLLFTCVNIFFLKEKKLIVGFLSGVLPLMGAAYASAMSANFKPDDIFLIFGASIYVFYGLSKPLRTFFVSAAALEICALYSIGIFFVDNFYVQIINLILLLTIAYLFLKQNKYIANSFFLPFFIVVFFMFIKVFPGNIYAWWESNIRARSITYFVDGFFVTPYYYKLITAYKEFSEIAIPLHEGVYSFPTSTNPYHYFKYNPPWKYAIHHADVFPKSAVDTEFSLIESSNPGVVVLTQWTSEKNQELDKTFSSDGTSSQTALSHLLTPWLKLNYTLCLVVEVTDAESYNFPTLFYVRNDVLPEFRNCDRSINYITGVRLNPK